MATKNINETLSLTTSGTVVPGAQQIPGPPLGIASQPQLHLVKTDKGYLRVEPVDVVLYNYKVARNLSATLLKRRQRNVEWHDQNTQHVYGCIPEGSPLTTAGDSPSLPAPHSPLSPLSAPRSILHHPSSALSSSYSSPGSSCSAGSSKVQSAAMLESLASQNGGTIIRGSGSFSGSAPLKSRNTQGVMFERYAATEPDLNQVQALYLRPTDNRSPAAMLDTITKIVVGRAESRESSRSEAALRGGRTPPPPRHPRTTNQIDSRTTLPNGVPTSRLRHHDDGHLKPLQAGIMTPEAPSIPLVKGRSHRVAASTPSLYDTNVMQGSHQDVVAEDPETAARNLFKQQSRTARTGPDPETKALIARLNANLDAILDNFGVRTGV